MDVIPEDKKVFIGKVLDELEKNSPGQKKLPPLTRAVFIEELHKFSDNDIKESVKLHVRHKRTLPTPKELVDNAQSILDSRRREASYNRGNGERFRDSPFGQACRDYIQRVLGAWSNKPKLERYKLQREWHEIHYRNAHTLVRAGTSNSELEEIKRELKSEYIRFNNLIKELELGKQQE